jgi:hypothetical protein
VARKRKQEAKAQQAVAAADGASCSRDRYWGNGDMGGRPVDRAAANVTQDLYGCADWLKQ